jgi:hypothetical protein
MVEGAPLDEALKTAKPVPGTLAEVPGGQLARTQRPREGAA